MKPSIDQQIEAVECAISQSESFTLQGLEAELRAAVATLHWVKRHAPTIKALKEEFPGARFVERSED